MATAELSRTLAAEVMARCLSDHERNLLKMAGQSIGKATALYGRQYGGENGVVDAVEAIKRKVQAALDARLDQAATAEVPLEDHWASGADSRETSGIPLKVVAGATERVPDASPAPARAIARATPPRVSGLAPSSRGLQEDEFALDGAAPATASARGREIVRLLGLQRMSTTRMGRILHVNGGKMKAHLARLEVQGVVARSNENAYDWPNAPRSGRPSRVWMLVDEPEGVREACGQAARSEPEAYSRSAASKPAKVTIAPTLPPADEVWWACASCEHRNAPASQVCIRCGKRRGDELLKRVNVAVSERGDGELAELPEWLPTRLGGVIVWEPREMWRLLSPEQRREMAAVVAEAIVSVLL